MCSHEVGKDLLKCATCSKWVHFFCSSLTRANFRKICAAGSTMGWNCPARLNGDLASPTHQQPFSAPSFQLRPLPHSPTNMFTFNGFISTSTLTPSLLNTYPLSAFTLPFTPPPHQPIYNSPPHPQRTPCLPQNLRILQWNAGGLSPSRRAELIAFLSGNQYDLILLQETHLSATKNFQIPGYSTLRTDRTFGRQSPVSSGAHYTGGGVLTLIRSDLAFSPVSVSSLSSQDPYSDYICVKFFFPTTFPYNSLTSTPLLSEALLLNLAPGPSLLTSFQTPLTLLSLETSMLTTQPGKTLPPNPPGNDLFRWITSSGLETLSDPASPTLLHHSTGSRSSPDILLAPASLAPQCEWCTLPGLGSDHLPIEIVLPLSPVHHSNTRTPKFNYKKAPSGCLPIIYC